VVKTLLFVAGRAGAETGKTWSTSWSQPGEDRKLQWSII